ncbi:hypothetical protein BQ9231_00418 [Cedratvirus lausannensis]|uniref:Uncharacterized protein n=1 Tax=Cedratvirus lausannensis TaxID=2023205 RepID=A0A285PXD8_9VIRU|nr:hypothetical protein Cbor_210 [Cedratvirus borely]SOB74301.1 hypothetical protein BQ9231_00418 [Cedratvirus lausannensis]
MSWESLVRSYFEVMDRPERACDVCKRELTHDEAAYCGDCNKFYCHPKNTNRRCMRPSLGVLCIEYYCPTCYEEDD